MTKDTSMVIRRSAGITANMLRLATEDSESPLYCRRYDARNLIPAIENVSLILPDNFVLQLQLLAGILENRPFDLSHSHLPQKSKSQPSGNLFWIFSSCLRSSSQPFCLVSFGQRNVFLGSFVTLVILQPARLNVTRAPLMHSPSHCLDLFSGTGRTMGGR